MAMPKDYRRYWQPSWLEGQFAPSWNTPIDYDPGNLDIPIDEREEYHKQKKRRYPGIHPEDPAYPKPEWAPPGEFMPQGPRPNFIPLYRPTDGGRGPVAGGMNSWQNKWKDFRFKGV